MLANVVTSGQTKGLHLGWSPWIGVVLAISITTAIGLAFGALAGRSFGIYFLMLTLTLAVLVNSFFGSVTLLSGFGGVGGIQDATPSLIGNAEPRARTGSTTSSLVVAIVVYVVMRYLVRTPFGMTLQGIRDDPVRMASLGYNVTLHRMLAFGFAAFVASLAGILFGWWNDTINPGTVNLSSVIALLVIAVIGSLFRLEGAWVGAFAYVYISNEVENHNWTIPWLGGTFNTMIGVIFLVIVCLSPGGLLGMWGSRVRAAGQAYLHGFAAARRGRDRRGGSGTTARRRNGTMKGGQRVRTGQSEVGGFTADDGVRSSVMGCTTTGGQVHDQDQEAGSPPLAAGAARHGRRRGRARVDHGDDGLRQVVGDDSDQDRDPDRLQGRVRRVLRATTSAVRWRAVVAVRGREAEEPEQAVRTARRRPVGGHPLQIVGYRLRFGRHGRPRRSRRPSGSWSSSAPTS